MADIDPRLARLAQIAAARVALDASLGHTHFSPRSVPADEVLPERETKPHAWQSGGDATPPVEESVSESTADSSVPAAVFNADAAPFRQPPIGDEGSADKLNALAPVREEAWHCTKCSLCKTRTHVVFGQGSVDTDLVFVGEAPGGDEDAQGLPFVGRAGDLLTKMIEGGLKRPRSSVYICNILKCRPPGNRNPHPDEIGLCIPYLKRQLAIIRPRAICALGRIAANALTGEDASLGRMRNRWHECAGIPLMPTYHPAYLLRQRGAGGQRSEADYKTWEDLKMIIELLGE